MRKMFVLFLLCFSLFSWGITSMHASFFDDSAGNTTIRYCDNGECGLDEGIDAIRGRVDGVESTRSLSEYIQDVVIYALGFVSLLAVVYIIYNGFMILTANGDEEKVKKARQSIMYVAVGIIVMWLAWSVTLFILRLVGA